MKLIILSCLIAVVYSISTEYRTKVMDKLTNIAGTCIPEVGATDDDVGEIMDKKLPTRKEGKCLIACFGKHLGMMKDRKFDKESATASLGPLKAEDAELYEKSIEFVDQCATEMDSTSETDECELATKAVECLHNKAKAANINFDDIMA